MVFHHSTRNTKTFDMSTELATLNLHIAVHWWSWTLSRPFLAGLVKVQEFFDFLNLRDVNTAGPNFLGTHVNLGPRTPITNCLLLEGVNTLGVGEVRYHWEQMLSYLVFCSPCTFHIWSFRMTRAGGSVKHVPFVC